MDDAISHKLQHPQQPYREVADHSHVASSTLHDRVTGKHAARGERHSRNLSIEQEGVLLGEINAYAERGTLLTPSHITQLATALAGHPLGQNWTSTFLKRHKERVSSKFYRVQEVARLNADTPSNRQAFYSLVCLIQRDWSRTDRVLVQGRPRYWSIHFLQHLQHG